MCRGQTRLNGNLLGALRKERGDGTGERPREAIDETGAHERQTAARRVVDRGGDLAGLGRRAEARWRISSPAGVNARGRTLRSNSVTPVFCSRSPIAWEIAG